MPDYKNLTWDNDFDQWSLVKYDIPMDGHCLFHAVSLAFFKPYITENFNGRSITRLQVIHNLRKELADKLSTPINGKNGKTYYDLLNNGYTSTFAKTIPEFSLRHMQSELNSNHFIGYGYIEYIGDQLNKDIYIINGDTKDIYHSDEINIKNRKSIVLYYKNNHFELIGMKKNNQIITHFNPNNPFIEFLKSRKI